MNRQKRGRFVFKKRPLLLVPVSATLCFFFVRHHFRGVGTTDEAIAEIFVFKVIVS